MRRLKGILSKILEIDERNISDDTSVDNTATWDSFNALLMISEIENCFKVKFTMEEVMVVRCVREIKNVLKKYRIELYED